MIGTIVHFSTLIVLVEVFKMGAVISSVLGFILTVILSFHLNVKYTFKQTNKNQKRLLTKYVVVSLVGLFLNSGIMYVTIEIFSFHYFFGQALVVLCIPIVNFLLNNAWTFKADHDEQQEG